MRGLTLTQAKEKIVLQLRKFLSDEVLGLIASDAESNKPYAVAPRDTINVFVDVSRYNSKYYYVQGDVAAPGKMPFTGKETVLDAINFAGGLLPGVPSQAIELDRPARGGKPARTYPVDLQAIQKGDAKQNYQIFPDDRLIVDRNRHVTKADFKR